MRKNKTNKQTNKRKNKQKVKFIFVIKFVFVCYKDGKKWRSLKFENKQKGFLNKKSLN